MSKSVYPVWGQRFNVAIVEPPGFRFAHFLYDAARYLVAGLEELGHDCILSRNALAPGRVNVLVNAHTLPSVEAMGELLVTGNGAPYVVLQSEIVQAGKSNVGPQAQELVYLPLLRGARAVWDLLPENAAYLCSLGIKARCLRFGYARALEEIQHKREKDIDFLFFGSLTKHRIAVLRTLQRAIPASAVRVVFDPVAIYRNDLIARSRIVLSIRQGGGYGHLPWLRILYSVNQGSLVVSEECEGQDWIAEAFVSAPPGRFVEVCADALRDELEGRERGKVKLANLQTLPCMAAHLAPFVAALV